MQKTSVLKQCVMLMFAVGSLVGIAPAWAQVYPTKPIQLFVAFAPGGAGDIIARVVAKKLGENLGQPIVIENRPSPVVAVVTVAKAKPDGYTLMMAGSGTALTSGLFKSLPYDVMGDFIHVSTMASFDMSLITGTQSGFQTVSDVLAFAKANPGKLNIATVRIGSTQHLTAELFKSLSGIDALIVPYKTTAEIVTALRAKDVHVAIEMLPPVLGQISGKTVKALAMTSGSRFPGMPDVPTLAESGLPGFEAASWNGISVPANTPPAIVNKLSKELEVAIASSEVQRELQALGIVAQASTPEQMTRRMRNDMAKWKTLIDKAGIPKQ